MEKEEVILPPINEEDWMWSGLCYPFWFIFSPWTLKTKKKDDLFIWFHALQGLHFGFFTSTLTLISTLIVYFVFFRPNMEQLALTTGDQMRSRLTCGGFAVIVMLGFLLMLAFILFITLYYGWRAANGKMFKIPFIGKRAWEIVYAKKDEVESEYYQSPLGRMELQARQRTPQSLDADIKEASTSLGNTIPSSPAVDIVVPLNKNGNVDYEALMRQMPPIDKIKSIFAPQQTIPVEEEPLTYQDVQEERQLSPLEKLALLRKQQSGKAVDTGMEYPEHEESDEDLDDEAEYVEILQEPSIQANTIRQITNGNEEPMLFREDMQSLSPQEQIALLRKQQELERQKAEKEETGEEIEVLQEEIQEVEEEPELQTPAYPDPGEMFFRIQQQRLGMIPAEEKEPSEELKETVSSAPPVRHLTPLEQLSMMRKQQKERQEQLGFTEEEETRNIRRAQPTGRLDPSVLLGMTKKEISEPEPPVRQKPAATKFLGRTPDNLSPLEQLSLRKKQQETGKAPAEPVGRRPSSAPTSRLDPSVLWGSKPDDKISMGAETPVKSPDNRRKPLTHLEKLSKLQEKKEQQQSASPQTGRTGRPPVIPGIKPKSPLEQISASRKETEAKKQEGREPQIISSVQEKSQRMKDLLSRMKDRTRMRGDELQGGEGGDENS